MNPCRFGASQAVTQPPVDGRRTREDLAFLQAGGPQPTPVSFTPSPDAACAAAGPIIQDATLGRPPNPVPGSTAGRLDMGRDGTAQQFVAPFNGTVAYSTPSDPGWRGGGYVAVQSSTDPADVLLRS